MELNEQDRQAQQALQASLTKLAEIDPQDLARTGVLGTALDFSDGIPVFERTLRLFRDLAEANLDNVPAVNLNSLKQTADQAQTAFDQIREFDPSGQNNPASIRDSLIQQIARQYDGHFNQISPIIAYSVRKGTDFAPGIAGSRRAYECSRATPLANQAGR